MPTYEFRCSEYRHTFDAQLPVEQRDAVQLCPLHQTRGVRVVGAGLQHPIVRAMGYSLKPGDRGYSDFETPHGRAAPWQQRKIEPFSRAEDFYAHPPEPVPPDTTVEL